MATKRVGRKPSADKEATSFGRYLIQHKIPFIDAAERLKLHPETVSSFASGKRRPSADTMWRIECWTRALGGTPVKMQDWFLHGPPRVAGSK